MMKLFKESKKAILVKEVMIGEVLDINEPVENSELKVFRKGENILVLGVSHYTDANEQYIVYSERLRESTTISGAFVLVEGENE